MKEIVTAAGTLAIAVGIGFVMQGSESAKERYGQAARPVTIPVPETPQGGESTGAMLMQVQEIELTSGTDEVAVPDRGIAPQRVSILGEIDVPTLSDLIPLEDDCAMKASAEPVAGAMARVTLDAPCAVNERLTVHHNGMMFTETTDADGILDVTVPALSEQAVFILAFSNGDGAVTQTDVPDVDEYDRVVLQWRGRAGFELHAREFGADYGAHGHVWSGVSQDPGGLMNGRGGFTMRLGDGIAAEPLIAEIYTFPSGMTVQSGMIDLSVEAEVTMGNCGLEIEAQSLERGAGDTLKTQDLTLNVPDCDAVGSFLVLNNLVSDLTVAAN